MNQGEQERPPVGVKDMIVKIFRRTTGNGGAGKRKPLFKGLNGGTKAFLRHGGPT
jgi:hypothetical protein